MSLSEDKVTNAPPFQACQFAQFAEQAIAKSRVSSEEDLPVSWRHSVGYISNHSCPARWDPTINGITNTRSMHVSKNNSDLYTIYVL